MATFNNNAFVKLIWKNERRIISPKMPKDIREGIDFFAQAMEGFRKAQRKHLNLPGKGAKERLMQWGDGNSRSQETNRETAKHGSGVSPRMMPGFT